MPRVAAPLDLNRGTDEERAAAARLSKRVGGDITSPIVDGYFGSLLHAPLLGERFSELGIFFRQAGVRGSFDDRRREFVDMVLAPVMGCAPVFFEHLGPAVEAGVRPEAVRALLDNDRDALTDSERVEVDYIWLVAEGQVDDASFAVIEAELSASGAVEYTAFIAFLIMTIRLFQALGVPDPAPEVISGLLADYAAGGEWPGGMPPR